MSPFSNKHSETVSSLGEQNLLGAIRRWLGRANPRAPFGIGDDCAVLPGRASAQLLTVDPVIYGEHFDDEVPARWVGEKLFKRNLSDIAAMGGKPRAAVVALALDSRVKTTWLRSFYQGLASVSLRYKVPLVGGDIAHQKEGIAATLTLVGEAQKGGRVLTRKGARRGDWIYVTGELGGSLASGHHYRFEPRLAEGAWLARQDCLRSMMDVSDGLAKDLHALCPTGLSPALNPAALPCRRGCDMRAALCDGEDFELLFTVAKDTDLSRFEGRFGRAFPRTKLSRIGSFVSVGQKPENTIPLSEYRGFEHLRS